MTLLKSSRFGLPALAFVALCLPIGRASAQGFSLNEVGTCAISRGFAVTGSPCSDASTIFWNPAAAAELTGKSISIGASDVAVRGSFRQDSTGRRYGSNITPAIVPAGFAAMRVGRASIGIGVYVPYGLTSQWNDNFPGRFSALKASLQTIYIQPNFAFQANDHWSVGGGPVFGHSSVELTQALDLSQQTAAGPVTFGMLGIASETEFGRAKFNGSSNAVGYNVGVHGIFGDWSIGARFISQLTFKYNDADATFTQVPTNLTLPVNNPINPSSAVPVDALLAGQFNPGGALVSQTGSSKIVHPWQMQGGVGYNGFTGTKLSVDVARLGWSSFKTLPISFDGPAAAESRSLIEDYDDSWALRFGVEHRFNSWTARAGYSFANSPAPDVTVTPLLPDMNRRNLAGGVEIPMGQRYRFDLAYLHVNTPGRRGRTAERASLSQDVIQLNSGTYELSADVVSVALNVHF
ncbi:MAG: outer membrane protein transport protein [Gemmatimonadaceae bacterium]